MTQIPPLHRPEAPPLLRPRPIFDKPFETLVGAAVLLVAMIFVAVVIKRTDSTSPRSYPLFAEFQNLQGIAVGNAVKISGIKVGEVRNVSLDRDSYQARLEIGVNKGIDIPDDTLITIGSEGLLGGQYIRLLPGGSDNMLKPGEKFHYSQGSVDLSELLGKIFMSAGQSQSQSSQPDGQGQTGQGQTSPQAKGKQP
ncbi:MAG: outer membrane lipid asymmetry maintenance protein MlaD [Candidatus Symbiobacter sp.]|nr:outer membrane lipid asymmetry maintenance protein MlaD [Candidatus Symbiobacter sp.]